MKIILNKSHLNAHGRTKLINDLTIIDFDLPMRLVRMAHKILYVSGNRCLVLKNRFPTEYSLIKR